MTELLQVHRVLAIVFVVLATPTLQSRYAHSTPPENREDAISCHGDVLRNAAQRELDEQGLRDFAKEFEARALCRRVYCHNHRRGAAQLLKQILDVLRETKNAETIISPLWVRVELFPPNKIYEVVYRTQDKAPYAITSLEITDVTDKRPSYTLTTDNLGEVFAELEQSGFSGIVHVRKNGDVLLDKAYGLANEEFGYPIKRDTVFGIGSTPMDFTLVSIFLLEQRGKISQDDTLNRYFDSVPADKESITIRQLVTGKSGLPNFFDTEDDWDADLAYLNRKAAEERLFAQELLFKPGKGTSHSHGAFGLLSSIIERVSGKDYYTFLKENFFNPAGMTRTAMNGNSMGLPLSEFAVGQGPTYFGLPNIPPNWGKTSWLVLGSGGMCSTMEDMLKFYALVRSEKVLKPPYNRRFNRFGASLNGSMRGAYLSHAYTGVNDEAILMSNIDADSPREGDVDEKMTAIVRALEGFIRDEGLQ